MSNWKYPIKDCKEKIELCLNQIEKETGLHITNVLTENASYALEEYPYQICNFNIMETPGIRYALWCSECFGNKQEQIDKNETLWTDYYGVPFNTEIVFFCEIEDNIDKFKPSYGEFLRGIYRNVWIKEPENKEELEEYINDDGIYNLDDIPELLQYFEKHYFKSYVYIGRGIEGIQYEMSDIKVLTTYLRDKHFVHKYNRKTERKRRKAARLATKLAKKCKSMDTFVMDTGNEHFVQMELRCRHKKDFNMNQYIKDTELLEKYEDRYWNLFTIEQWEYDATQEFTKETIKKDNDLCKRFYKGIESLIKDYNDKEGFVYKIYYNNIINS